MALEFNIDPASTEDEFVHNIKRVMQQMQESLPDDLEIVVTPVAHFTKKHMAEQPDEARELGCNPDFNAWDGGKANPRPNGDVNFRTGAGHIHIGWTTDADINDPRHLEACQILVKALDNTLGALACLFDDGVKRRQLYGAAGAYRPKSYGVEYRVLSNAWLKDEETMRWVYRTVCKVFEELRTHRLSQYLVQMPAPHSKALKVKDPKTGLVGRLLRHFVRHQGYTPPPNTYPKGVDFNSFAAYEWV
jgi:hypothetical protein